MLVFIEKAESKMVGGKLRSFCKAECSYCNTVKEVRRDMVEKHNSCGCTRPGKGWRFNDLKGETFDNLLVLDRAPSRGGIVRWTCLCKCGKETVVPGKALSSGHTGSCGCRGVSSDFGWVSHLHCSYRIGAERRKIDFNLSLSEFRDLIIRDCHYCGAPPSSKDGRKDVASGKFKNPIPINGIDRQDNSIGYVSTNAVACCTMCNRGKGTSTLDEFKLWVSRLVDFNNRSTALMVTGASNNPSV